MYWVGGEELEEYSFEISNQRLATGVLLSDH